LGWRPAANHSQLSGEAPLCRVDRDNFHEILEEHFRSLAQKIADDTRQRGRSRPSCR
jgi:CRP-like cAMP-binding protein